jgi:dipeptidase E
MRMYLSSFRLGNHPDDLVSLVEPGSRGAVIANAMDDEPGADREAGVRRELAALRHLAIDADEVDLRAYLGQREKLDRDLRSYGLVWARGGNVFMLRYSLAASGADEVLRALLNEDALVYGGYSAGACVLGPTLRGFELADDPSTVEAVYAEPAVWDGLGILDHVIVPHVDSPGHPETERCNAIAERYRAEGVPHWTLRDGQAIVIDGSAVVLR